MIAVWESVETLPALGKQGLQIWRIELPEESTPLDNFTSLLSSEEQARAERLRAGRVRLQFAVARSSLRILLGNCLGIHPARVPIAPSSYGKPQTPGVSYNVAHSGDTILIALCRDHRVGVDVEYFSRETDALEIAKHSFAESEYLELSAIAEPDQLRRAFFRCWTRKEAIVKADGRGLSLPLTSFQVPVEQPAYATPVAIREDASSSDSVYYVTDIPLGDEIAAACAVSSRMYEARGFKFPLSTRVRTS
jgi:4'-phosphopantetheinyl transferase